MDENRIKKALKLLQEALAILKGVALTEPTSDRLAIEMACEDLAGAVETVGGRKHQTIHRENERLESGAHVASGAGRVSGTIRARDFCVVTFARRAIRRRRRSDELRRPIWRAVRRAWRREEDRLRPVGRRVGNRRVGLESRR